MRPAVLYFGKPKIPERIRRLPLSSIFNPKTLVETLSCLHQRRLREKIELKEENNLLRDRILREKH